MIETDKLTGAERQPEQVISATPASARTRRRFERALRPRQLDEYVGQEKMRGQLEIFISGRATAAGSPGPRAAVRPAGPRQDHAAPTSSRARWA